MPDSDTPTTRRTQEERRTIAEQRLVDAAAEIISEGGLSSVTLANVGERAGYSRGLATHRFGSRAGLIQRVADAVTQQFTDLIAAAGQSESALDDLRIYVRTYIEVVTHPRTINRAQLMLIADSVANPYGEARESVVAYDKLLRRHVSSLVERAIHDGDIDAAIDPRAFATTVIGVLRGASFEALLDPRIDLGAVGDVIERLLDGVSTPERRADGAQPR